MRVNSSDLPNSLTSSASNPPKILLVNGNEALLVEEALDQIRNFYREQGFSERLKFQAEASFDWNQISGVGQAMSLFAQKRMIELRVTKTLGRIGTGAIAEYCENLPDDDVLVVLMPALDKRQRSAKWCKSVDFNGWLVDVYDVDRTQFPAWLKRRLQSRSLRVEAGVVEMMSDQLEGNVLAAAQEIDKLKVLATDGAVTLELLQKSMADQARFDVFALSEAMLLGDLQRVLRVKQRLQSEGVEPVIVVWALVREIRTLCALSEALSQGHARGQLFRTHRIWSKREPAVNSALNRLDAQNWSDLLVEAARLDQTVKGQRYKEPGSVWHQIELICAKVCGVSLTQDTERKAS